MDAKALKAESERSKDTPEPGELDSLLRAPSSRSTAAQAAVVLGRIVAVGADGAPFIELPGSDGIRVARLASALCVDQLRAALHNQQQVVLSFENGDPGLPIIMGFLQPAAAQTHTAAASQVVEADVDGKRVRIVAAEEIVLQCGAASITLRRNGRVVVRGTYIETSSEGTNRIKGGQVRIN